jgi:hypothetical protein
VTAAVDRLGPLEKKIITMAGKWQTFCRIMAGHFEMDMLLWYQREMTIAIRELNRVAFFVEIRTVRHATESLNIHVLPIFLTASETGRYFCKTQVGSFYPVKESPFLNSLETLDNSLFVIMVTLFLITDLSFLTPGNRADDNLKKWRDVVCCT